MTVSPTAMFATAFPSSRAFVAQAGIRIFRVVPAAFAAVTVICTNRVNRNNTAVSDKKQHVHFSGRGQACRVKPQLQPTGSDKIRRLTVAVSPNGYVELTTTVALPGRRWSASGNEETILSACQEFVNIAIMYTMPSSPAAATVARSGTSEARTIACAAGSKKTVDCANFGCRRFFCVSIIFTNMLKTKRET